MGDVFISYARTDQPIARRVAKVLSDRGFDVWWDDQLPAHKAYSEIIEQRLRDAKAVVVLWSAAAAASQWVRAEADYARNANKLVQAQVDGAIPPMPFNQIQCADLKGWRGAVKHPGWTKLLGSVEALVSGTEPADRPTSAFGWRDRLNVRWAAAAVALVIAAVGAWYMLMPPSDAGRPVLAVLPFQSLDQRDASLVAGIWEDTRQAIGRNPQLLVLGPNTSEEIAEKGVDATRDLADYLVQANVRSVGDRIRVSANLVRTKDDSQLWSKNFDRRLDDVFALQSEIANEIEGHIRGRLASGGGVKPENIATSGEVYALYSDARAKIRKREMGKYGEAHEQLERVVRMDPNFAPGWATLAVVKGFGFSSSSNREADARRAIALAPNLAAGHAALGFTLQSGPAAQASLRRALQLDPNDIEALNWMANSLNSATQMQEKLRLYSEVVEREPLWWPAILNKINMLYRIGDLAAVEQELARVERVDEFMGAVVKGDLLAKKGDLSGAVNALLPAYRSGSEDQRQLLTNSLHLPLLQLGQFEVADKIFPAPSRFVPFIRRNDPKVINMIEAAMPPEKFWTFGLLPQVTARVYLLNNQGERLAKRYRAVAANAEQFEALVGRSQIADLGPLAALALRSVGDEAQARRLLELAEAAALKEPALDGDQQVRLARIRAVQGRTDEATALLSAAVRRGWLPNYLPLHTDIGIDPPLALLKADPRFEPLRQQILRHLAKEQAELGEVKL